MEGRITAEQARRLAAESELVVPDVSNHMDIVGELIRAAASRQHTEIRYPDPRVSSKRATLKEIKAIAVRLRHDGYEVLELRCNPKQLLISWGE